MQSAGKYQQPEMHFWNGRSNWPDSLCLDGTDVYHSEEGKVSQQWLSGCREERALTTDLMEQIAEPSNLAAALQQVVQNKGSAGIDGVEVEELQEQFAGSHRQIAESLEAGMYQPKAVRGVQIEKYSGGYRQLGIPTAKDRLVQQAISQVMMKRYDTTFSESS